jgi:hypothetical protein
MSTSSSVRRAAALGWLLLVVLVLAFALGSDQVPHVR